MYKVEQTVCVEISQNKRDQLSNYTFHFRLVYVLVFVDKLGKMEVRFPTVPLQGYILSFLSGSNKTLYNTNMSLLKKCHFEYCLYHDPQLCHRNSKTDTVTQSRTHQSKNLTLCPRDSERMRLGKSAHFLLLFTLLWIQNKAVVAHPCSRSVGRVLLSETTCLRRGKTRWTCSMLILDSQGQIRSSVFICELTHPWPCLVRGI